MSRQACEGKVAAWSKKQSVDKFKELTGLADESFDLQPGLHNNGFIAVHSSGRASTAAKLIGYLAACKRGSQNLTASMLYSWALKARTTFESEARLAYDGIHAELVSLEEGDAAATRRPKKKPQCWEMDMCLCDEKGKQV